jgi:hypothetical protein
VERATLLYAIGLSFFITLGERSLGQAPIKRWRAFFPLTDDRLVAVLMSRC